MIAASAALTVSGIPFADPVGAVRMGMIDGKLVINPNYEQKESGQLDLVVAGTNEAITMIEAGAKEVTSEQMLSALELAHKYIKEVCEVQTKLKALVNPELKKHSTFETNEEAVAKIKGAIDQEKLNQAVGRTKKRFQKLPT